MTFVLRNINEEIEEKESEFTGYVLSVGQKLGLPRPRPVLLGSGEVEFMRRPRRSFFTEPYVYRFPEFKELIL